VRARRGMRTKLAQLEVAAPEPTVQNEGETAGFVRHGHLASNAIRAEKPLGPVQQHGNLLLRAPPGRCARWLIATHA
jgi:hypothetical protein